MTRAGALALAAVALLAVPAAASISVVAKQFGPFDTPFEDAGASAIARKLGGVARKTEPLLPALEIAAPEPAGSDGHADLGGGRAVHL